MTADSIRASDAERDQVTGILQSAVAEGRLTPEEGGERLAAVSAARYRDELGHLVHDLPATVETVSLPPALRGAGWIGFAARLVRGLAFGAVFVALALWGFGFFLPFWIAGLVALAIITRGRRGRRWHRAAHWRARGWYGGAWRLGPSSRPW